jgi:carbamate kinase
MRIRQPTEAAEHLQLQKLRVIEAQRIDAVYADWHTPCERVLSEVSVAGLRSMSFPAGSMGPKVEAACEFVSRTGRPAVIGSLDHIEAMANGTAGTRVVCA